MSSFHSEPKLRPQNENKFYLVTQPENNRSIIREETATTRKKLKQFE